MVIPTTVPKILSPFEKKVQIGFFGLYIALSTILLFYINLTTLKLNSSNPYGKKILYLFYILVNYVLTHSAFKHIHPILTTILPMLIIFIVNKFFGDVVIMGLTGGIACGKSTLVDGIKKKFDIKVIDCDEISRIVSLPGHAGYNFIVKMLGEEKDKYVDVATGMIRRDKLGELTFNDREFRNKLTKGLGKYIFLELSKQLLKHLFSGNKFILIDAPILFETKVLAYICYPIIVVYVDQQEQIKRLQERNKYTRQEALNRIKSQMPLQQKKARGNICIDNAGTKEQLVRDCEMALEKFLKKVRQ